MADELTQYTRTQRALEMVGIALYGALAAWALARLAAAPGWLVAAALVAAWIAADFLSGVTHWAFDTWGNVRTPLIGRSFIRPFREHHRDPAAMTRHGFLELTGNSCLGVSPVLGLAAGQPWSPFLDAGLIAFSLALFGTNLFHKWAHSEKVPRIVGWLQRRHLILNPARHQVHHTPPNRTAYCVTSGWMNALLDRILP